MVELVLYDENYDMVKKTVQHIAVYCMLCVSGSGARSCFSAVASEIWMSQLWAVYN